MKKIAVALRKGGSTKTTAAVHIAHGLAMAGNRVCLIDLDPQGHTAVLLGAEYEYTMSDVLEGKIKASQSLTEARERLFLLPSDYTLAHAAKVHLQRSVNPQYILSEKLEDLTGFDYVILDTPPSLSDLTVNAIFYADELLSPVPLEVMSFDALRAMMDEISVYAKHGGAPIRYIMPTLLEGGTRTYKRVMPQMEKGYESLLIPGIRKYQLFRELSGETIYEADSSGKGSFDYAQVVKAVING
jgi:chromosome partitioning protein